jgi:hypothetical protein
MKAMEILSESKRLDEAPSGMLGQIARRAGAGVLGAMGLNTLAGEINDKADVGMFANRYYKEFMNYLKSRNRNPEQATFGDLKSFMSKNKIPTHNVPNNPAGSASKEMVNSILNQTAGEYLSGAGTPTGDSTSQKKQKQSNVSASPAATVNNQTSTSTGNTPAANIKVDDLIKQIPQMNAKQLSKIEQAIQTAKNAITPKTPSDIRAAKQASAAKDAQAQMTPVSSTAAKTPADVRAEKQAKAAQTAQAQMANTPATTPTPRRKSRRRGRKVTAAI